MTRHDRRWTFLTSHARVLVALSRDPNARLRTIAAACQITERTVQVIIADLEHAGYLRRQRAGRGNQYILSLDQPFRHPAEGGLFVRALVELAASAAPSAQPPRTPSVSGTVSKTRRT
ncbi:helix-turn-helix transcriptional regulator [Streptomyces sp. NPDC002285]